MGLHLGCPNSCEVLLGLLPEGGKRNLLLSMNVTEMVKRVIKETCCLYIVGSWLFKGILCYWKFWSYFERGYRPLELAECVY